MSKLLRCKCLSRAKDHVPGVMNYNVQPAILSDDLCDCGIGRVLRLYIQLNGPQIHLILLRKPIRRLHLRCIAPFGVPHAGIHHMSGLCERACCKRTKSTRCSRNHNHVLHNFSFEPCGSAPSPDHCYVLRHATVCPQNLPVNPGAIRSSQKGDHVGDVFNLSKPLQWIQLA